MKVKAYIVVLVLALITLTTSCVSREDFFDLANDIINPEIKISYPKSGPGLNFGDVEQYSSKDETITLENSGDIDLIITEIAVTGSAPDKSFFNYSQMPLVVEVGGITTFRVIFKPSALGPKDALITIVNSDSSDDKYSIQVFGFGKQPTGPLISVSLKTNDVSDMNAVDFGSIENGLTSLPARFVIENIGYADLIIRDIFPATNDIHSFIVDDMLTSYTIGAGESSTFDVVFHPLDDDELKSDIVIESNAMNTGNYSIGVNGYGLSSPSTEPDINVIQQGSDPNLLGISGYESFDFGKVYSVNTDTMIFSIQNTGTSQLTVSSISSSKPTIFKEQSLITPAYINEGESVTFEVTFNPGGGPGDEELVAVISIDSDDPDIIEDPYTFEVRGTRTNDNIAKLKVHQDGFYITPDTGIYSFGQKDIDTQTTVSFTLENVGMADLVVDGIDSSNIDNFAITNIPPTVKASESETFEITFKLTEVGVFSSVITIDNSDPDLSSGFVFNVTGGSIYLPKITVYENMDVFEHNTPYKFGSVEVGSTKGPVWFEIKNTGEADLVIDLPILIDVEDSRHFELDTTSIADFVIKKDGSESFYVTFKPDEEGTFHNSSGVAVEFATNDPDRKLFRIRLWGEGTSD
ncbi:MAG TPA: choice-of-anchor D domain-containing protein [Spirochaetes bacterium]|nr:choice-of-anchor D domain-containing protein [Spirochaetota bacterium]